MASSADTLRAEGLAAIGRHDWNEAFELLTRADTEGGLPPEALEALAEAAWWTSRLDACIAARERAFAGYSESGRRDRAAIVALALAKDQFAKGAPSIATAWVNRAERLLADAPDSFAVGWLERLRSVMALEGAGDYEAALEHARRASEAAVRHGDAELAAVALHDEGRALLMLGDVDAGMALIDEATAPAVAGELSPYNTGVVYCNTITACKDVADYRRAGDWTEAAKRWCDRQEIAGFPGMCRVYRASIMMLRGAWPEAEIEARRACAELPGFNVGYAAEAFYELGEIRLRAGDLAAAGKAFTEAHELGRDPQPGLGLLRLIEGRPAAAASCLAQALDDEGRPLHRARLLPAQVEAALAAGELDVTRRAVEELDAIASRFTTDAIRAAAHVSRARLALAEGDARAAARDARQAVRLWQTVDAPYETARARVVAGDAQAAQANEEDARLEFEAAAAAFERLGAVHDARIARARAGRLDTAAGADAALAVRTFLFTDIVQSTPLVEAIGDEAWGDLVGWHDKTLRELFAAHGGEEVDHAGDGFFVAFERADDALECAVAVQRRLAAHRREHGFAPRVRIGAHAAGAVRRGNGYRGRGVHAAARVAALADGGEIVVSSETLADAAAPPPTGDRRSVPLKGLEEPVEVAWIDWR